MKEKFPEKFMDVILRREIYCLFLFIVIMQDHGGRSFQKSPRSLDRPFQLSESISTPQKTWAG